MTHNTKRTLSLITVGLLLAASNMAGAAVIAVSSSINAEVRANAHNGPFVTDSNFVSQGGAINSLDAGSVLATATANSGFGPSTVNASASGRATWDSSSSGQVVFEDVGWRQTVAPHQSTSANTTFTTWRYNFIADVSGQFRIDYDIVINPETTNPFALGGFWVGLSANDILHAGTSGTFTHAIVAGREYTAFISSRAGIINGGTRTALMDGVFNWSMDSGPEPVPMPASVFVLSVGLVLMHLGHLVRPRKT